MDSKSSEELIRPKVKKYLEGLGYPPDSILFEYPTPHYAKLDAVVKINDRVLIACEIKSKVNLNTVSEIGYDPIARKLQKETEELKIWSYFISDGVNHIWLRTGHSGRPEISNPIKFEQFKLGKQESNFLHDKLRLLLDVVRTNPITGDYLYDLSILIYYRIFQERSQENWETINLDWLISEINRLGNDLKSSNIRESYSKAQYILESESLIKNYKTVFKFIDYVFETRKGEWTVPRWLGDFIASILDIKPNHTVLDLYAQNGILTAAANQMGAQRTISIFNNDRDKFWILIHQLLTNRDNGDIRFEPSLLNAPFLATEANTVDRVILAPPFNIKFENYNLIEYESGVNDSTVILTEVALKAINPTGRIAVVVPENFFSSGYFRKARSYFKEEARIEAIISLPNNTFHPFSSVKTSLLVLTKRKIARDTFFASVEDAYNITDKSIAPNVIEQILFNLSQFRTDFEFPQSNLGFIVDELDTDSFQYSKYWLARNYQSLSGVHGFTTVPLKELALEIHRGSAVVEDKDAGDIPFIGPAAVRKMMILPESLSYTVKSRIPVKSVITERDDILINSIGNYRGSAALVKDGSIGMPINRHIFLIKPNNNFVLPGYLSVVLNSEFVAEQLLDRSTGVIPALSLRSFEQVYIPLPSISEQERIFSEFLELSMAIEKNENELHTLNRTLNERLSRLGKEASQL